MNPNLNRALMLFEQKRYDLAEKELRLAISEDPQESYPHALLAICLAEQEHFDEAAEEARQGIYLAPDFAYAHYALAKVLLERHRIDDSLSSIREAIRLDPEDADYYGFEAALFIESRDWKGALSAADQGLALDAENVGCANLRAFALTKLGRQEEAGQTISAALQKEPDNAFTHANQGWALLEKRKKKDAIAHFQESLRLDPEDEWAKAGLVEAIKLGNPIYAIMLSYFLWMQKLSSRAQWLVILGGYFGNRYLGSLSETNPALAPWLLPVRVLYFGFILLTWLAYPVFNLMLFFHSCGRHALSDEQRLQAKLVGACLGVGVFSILIATLPGQGHYIAMALVFGPLAIPVASVFNCSEGWPRKVMVLICIGLLTVGGIGAGIKVGIAPPEESELAGLASSLLGTYLLFLFISLWVSNFLSNKEPER